jgi:hypothetical protein
MTTLKTTWDWLAVEPHQRKGLRVLQFSIGMMLLFRVSTEARFTRYLWGPHGIGRGSLANWIDPRWARFGDMAFSTDVSAFAVVLLLGLGAMGLVLGWQTRLATMVTLAAYLLLESRLAELGDGGDNITRLVLTYMVFALPARATPERGALSVWLHNVAILAIGLQIGVLYLTSGFMKATGVKWSNGTAMYLISQVEWFSHPALRGMFINPFVTTLATYATVFFQLWFPVAVLTRLRLAWLICGIVLHLGIATFMGLVCFSIAMIGLELFLLRDEEYDRLEKWLGRLSALRARLPTHLPARTETRIEEP